MLFLASFPPILFTIEQFRYIGWERPFSLFFWAKKILRWSRSHKNECENWILWSVVTNQLLSLSLQKWWQSKTIKISINHLNGKIIQYKKREISVVKWVVHKLLPIIFIRNHTIVYFNENYMHMLRKAETNYQNKWYYFF